MKDLENPLENYTELPTFFRNGLVQTMIASQDEESIAKMLNIKAVQHVLAHFNEGGHTPGSFTTSLLDAFGHADVSNFYRLETAFPEEGLAMRVAEHTGGIELLKKVEQGYFRK